MSIESALTTFNKAIDQVLQYPAGPQRWRAANTFWLRLSPKHRAQYDAVVRENRQYREALSAMNNKFATSNDSNSGLRAYLSIPAGAYYAIRRADPDVFSEKRNAEKFFKEFPEYTSREVF